MNFIPELAVPLLVPPAMTALPVGVLEWSDAGAVLVWLVLMAFVGSLLGLLREMTGRVSDLIPEGHLRDEHLGHAA